MGGQSDALTAFSGLPAAEKHKVLLVTNPDYAALPGAEQAKALDSIHYGAAPDAGWRNNLADRIDQGRGAVERGVTSGMQGMGLPTNPDEADKFVKGDPDEAGGALGSMVRSHLDAGAKDPVGYVPLVGPLAVRASEHAQAGEYPEMVGDLAAGVATVSPFRDVAGRAGTNLGQRVAKATRTPEGDLGPVTQGAAKTAGGAAGAVAGYNASKSIAPEFPAYYGTAAGAGAGATMGPALADRIIPKVRPRTTPFEGTNMNWTPPGEMLGPESPTSAQLSLGRRVGERTAAAEAAEREPVSVSKSPSQYRGPQRTGVGVPGSPQQEAGYQPPVTRVPIRPEPSSPLTPEQVPGPDTQGKGNLLTPAAKRGDSRAAQETMRRGRQVMYVPAEEYPGTRLEGTLADRMGQSQPPNLAKRTSETGSFKTGIGPQSFEESGQMREGEVSPMAPAEKAELEQQAGRKLTDAEAYAERRRLAEWQSNQALRRGTVDVDPKQSAGLRDTQSKRKR